jgi:hypothetical protein
MDRRKALIATVGPGALWVTGCGNPPLASTEERYCYTPPRKGGVRPLCVPAMPKSRTAEVLSQRFESTPGLLTLIVVHEWSGYLANVVRVGLDGSALASTVPTSFVRVLVRAGVHRLSYEWPKGRKESEVQGEAGSVLFVGLKGMQWLNKVSYSAVTENQDARRDEARKSRMVADLNVAASS